MMTKEEWVQKATNLYLDMKPVVTEERLITYDECKGYAIELYNSLSEDELSEFSVEENVEIDKGYWES